MSVASRGLASALPAGASGTDLDIDRGLRRLVAVIIVLGLSYHAWLCLLHTLAFPVPRALVGVSELAIMLASLPLLVQRLLPSVLVTGALLMALVLLLTVLRGTVDIKSFRDLLIPVVFYWLGRNVGDPSVADRALTVALAVFFAFAAFEFFALRTYTSFFNIASYYISIGNMEPVGYPREYPLQKNGMRPPAMGRMLFQSVFGLHRVSSVFLEPVSVGNLATIVAAWGLAKDMDQWRRLVGFLVAAAALIILSDSRFGLACVSVLLLARVLLHRSLLYLPYLLPLFIVPALLLMGWAVNEAHGDNFFSRLVISGKALLNFDLTTTLGASPTAWFADMGYAQVISQFGLFGAMGLWVVLWGIPMPDERARRFRALAAIYIALVLCVSGTSVFAFKTAALLWFLMGCLLLDPAPAFRPAATRSDGDGHQGQPGRVVGVGVAS